MNMQLYLIFLSLLLTSNTYIASEKIILFSRDVPQELNDMMLITPKDNLKEFLLYAQICKNGYKYTRNYIRQSNLFNDHLPYLFNEIYNTSTSISRIPTCIKKIFLKHFRGIIAQVHFFNFFDSPHSKNIAIGKKILNTQKINNQFIFTLAYKNQTNQLHIVYNINVNNTSDFQPIHNKNTSFSIIIDEHDENKKNSIVFSKKALKIIHTIFNVLLLNKKNKPLCIQLKKEIPYTKFVKHYRLLQIISLHCPLVLSGTNIISSIQYKIPIEINNFYKKNTTYYQKLKDDINFFDITTLLSRQNIYDTYHTQDTEQKNVISALEIFFSNKLFNTLCIDHNKEKYTVRNCISKLYMFDENRLHDDQNLKTLITNMNNMTPFRYNKFDLADIQ